MFSEKNVLTIVKVVMIMVLTLFIVNSKPVETTRLFVVVMKSYKLETAKVVPVSQVRAPTPPSASNSCTYLPGPPGFSTTRHGCVKNYTTFFGQQHFGVKGCCCCFDRKQDLYSYTEGPANAFVVVVEKTYPMIKKA
nr:hypothetical protein CFP56_17134 [Quercus suber]